MGAADLLLWVGVGLLLAGFVVSMYRDHRIHVWGHLYRGVAFFLLMCSAVMKHNHMGAAWAAVFAAWHFYDWWNNGGGDGMKRRFRAWAGSLGRWAPQGT